MLQVWQEAKQLLNRPKLMGTMEALVDPEFGNAILLPQAERHKTWLQFSKEEAALEDTEATDEAIIDVLHGRAQRLAAEYKVLNHASCRLNMNVQELWRNSETYAVLVDYMENEAAASGDADRSAFDMFIAIAYRFNVMVPRHSWPPCCYEPIAEIYILSQAGCKVQWR